MLNNQNLELIEDIENNFNLIFLFKIKNIYPIKIFIKKI